MKYYILILLVFMSISLSFSQQDSQYTQYMYNTQVINPGYIGSKDVLSFGLLYRSQWVGFDGAPETGTFTLSSPIGEAKKMGLGLSIVNDQIGPSTETNIVVDYAYALMFSRVSKLSFGIKAGVNILDVDYTKLNIYDTNDSQFSENINNKLYPQIGAGIFYNTDKMYVGLSVPNLLNSKHYNTDNIDDINVDEFAIERLHYFLIGGYVFDLNENLKFKPATMVKLVDGSPIQADISANFLINEKITLGAAYRFDAAVTAMAGFQITNRLFIGMGYDYQTTDIETYSDGSYEVFIKFDVLKNVERILTPRFF
ncbi:PorP/SprF family type IX secretion system membrane protein [Winogradskyella arenosi]|uniref:Type IX secretion system PorP/SprF family membrane protein n=1 Tax=Winogradskyella arenosi TaxID=533325 RepID=A0A368ZGA0_9FLAO|nr:type IX secretion system membrane protein PorP/SprF [Winogradskyella arenosi]RCW91605.1 type IX secretion system PorP/SprF family membrane protein [Winogradskyella arenosi]